MCRLIKLDEIDEKDKCLLKLNVILSNNVFCLLKELVRLICRGRAKKKKKKTFGVVFRWKCFKYLKFKLPVNEQNDSCWE